MLFDKIMEQYRHLAKQENKKGDLAPFQYGDGGVEIKVTKNGKTKTIKEY
jgi:hypothetical protein